MMLYIGLVIGAIIGFGVAAFLVAGKDEVDTKQIYKDGMKDFALNLKSRVQKPEYPWEDFFICESDIDEVLKEMVGAESG